MSTLRGKLATLRRVALHEGWMGVGTTLAEKLMLGRVLLPPADYARLAPSALRLLARYGRPDYFVNAIGAGIGDDLLCTAMFHELRVRDAGAKVWITTRYPSLFEHNTDIQAIVPPLDRYDAVVKRLGAQIIYPWYTSYNPAFDRDDPMPNQHIISVMCQKAGITGEISLKPHFALTHGELRDGRVVSRQVAIQSSGLNAKHSMLNKNWPLERYQQVVNALASKYNFVQVGSAEDPPLDNVLDLRGRTSLRGTAAVLASSMALVGQVGLLMHLARAVDCRSVIVYGGRESPAQSGYNCNVNLFRQLPCSPCWKLNACAFERKCLDLVSVEDVSEAINQQTSLYGTPLPVDTCTITNEQMADGVSRHAGAVQLHQLAWRTLYQ